MVTTVPQEWRISEGLVPVSDVVRSAPVSRASIDVATRNGLIPVARQGGHGNTRWIRLEDALLVLAVAVLAATARVAFGSLLRTVRETGATVTSRGLNIPIAL